MAAALDELRIRLAEVSDLEPGGGGARLGPARDDAAARHRVARRAALDARADRARALHRRRDRAAARRGASRTSSRSRTTPTTRSLVRVTRRDWEKARRVPSELRAEMTLQAARGHHAWVEARRTSDFASFLPYLRTNVELKRRYVECFEWSDSPYTPLLDDYEPGMVTSEVSDGLRDAPARAHRARRSRAGGRRVVPPRATSPPTRSARSRSGSSPRWASRTAPGGSTRPRIPFCTSFSNRDVRLTTRYQPDDLESIWSTLHEAGHGLYAHGIADSLLRSPLGGRAVARGQRVAEPDVGEPRRPQPAASGSTGTSRSRRRFRACGTSTSTRSSARSTERSRDSSASTPTRPPTASTSSCASSSSRRSSRAPSRSRTCPRCGTPG